MGFTASQIADAFERKRAKRHADLEQWVYENPQWWAVGLATVGATSMDFLGGWVDALRLGEGSTEAANGGSWTGVAMDGLRVITQVSPFTGGARGAVGQAVRQGLIQRGLRLATRPRGIRGPCSFQAANNVAQLAKGQDVFVTVKEMARAKGVTRLVKRNGKIDLGAWFDELLPALRRLGIKGNPIMGIDTVEAAVAAAQRADGVVVFAFEARIVPKVGAERTVLHTVMAWRGPAGKVRFADYGGKVYESLEALCAQWGKLKSPPSLLTRPVAGGGIAPAATVVKTPYVDQHWLVRGADAAMGVLHLVGVPTLLARARVVETPEDGADIALPVLRVAATPETGNAAITSDVVAESLDNFTRRKDGLPLQATPPETAAIVPRAEYLTGVQYRLNHLGYGAGPVDGIMGPQTEKAVRAFQKEAVPPLRVDGIPGPKTQARLVEICGY